MYSVVLMMAMTGAGDTPAGLFSHGCCGGSCDGYAACSGCCGGWSSCHGCCGGYSSCHGGGHGNHGCCGGYSSCHGCHGGHMRHGHHSCHGCCGGCYSSCCGGWSTGCCGGYSGCCGGSTGCCGGYTGCCGGTVVVPDGKDGKKDGDGGTLRDTGKGGKSASVPAPATIVVELPADARLMVDDTLTTSTSALRYFVSPELNPGREYNYTLKAEFVREGKTVTLTKTVAVSAGNETKVTFENEATGVAAR
jgi:uncharacterized protein (TIGR03000 family)